MLFISVVSSLERPEHVHISLGEDASMVVVWSSRDLVNGILEYGVTSEKLDISVSGTVTGLPDEYYKANRYLYRSEIKVNGWRDREVHVIVIPWIIRLYEAIIHEL